MHRKNMIFKMDKANFETHIVLTLNFLKILIFKNIQPIKRKFITAGFINIYILIKPAVMNFL